MFSLLLGLFSFAVIVVLVMVLSVMDAGILMFFLPALILLVSFVVWCCIKVSK